jgi:hypothetical protein
MYLPDRAIPRLAVTRSCLSTEPGPRPHRRSTNHENNNSCHFVFHIILNSQSVTFEQLDVVKFSSTLLSDGER